MKRTKYSKRLPDAIRMSPETGFTQVSNQVLRDPNISFKAKGLLCLLLSNESGKWTSYQECIENMSAEGAGAIRSGLKELETAGYLLRIHYVDRATKRRKGSFWAYTDFPDQFEIDSHLEFLNDNNLEVQGQGIKEKLNSLKVDFPKVDFPKVENSTLIILNNKNTKEKQKASINPEEKSITPSMFETFWKLYPKPSKGSKGKTKTMWKRICTRAENRPTWEQIETAILEQMKTDQWQDARFIPLPTTWLNQERWQDDPADMSHQSWDNNNSGTNHNISVKGIIKQYFQGREALESSFMKKCFNPAKELLDTQDKTGRAQLAEAITRLHSQIQAAQNKNIAADKKDLFPGPVELIARYINWIESNDWITNRTVNIFDVGHTIFGRFRRDEAAQDNYERDPLTGKSRRIK